MDDVAGMHRSEFALNVEMAVFLAWCTLFLGVTWKLKKIRRAANIQLYIGFWWNSLNFTLTLEESKIVRYLDALDEAASAPSLTLRDRQSLATP